MIRAAIFAAAALVISAQLHAQNTRLTLGGFSGNIGTATVQDFDAGSRASSSAMTYTVAITSQNTQRVTEVYIRSNSASMGGSKPAADIEWRRNDLATWNAVTVSNALIENRTIQTNGTSWANSIWIRCRLNWLTDPSLVYSSTLTITLQVSAP